MGWFTGARRQANFLEDAVTEVCAATNLDRSTSRLFVADHKDLLLGAFHSGFDAVTSVQLIANGLVSLVFEGKSHSSPLVDKYDHGISRKYDPMAISYCLLVRNRSEFHEILEKIEAVISAGDDNV